MKSIFDKFKDITTFIFDADGVLTNGGVIVSDSGEHLRQFNVKDGYALQLAVKCGYNIAIISGGKAESIRVRLNDLGVTEVFIACKDKPAKFKEYISEKNIDPQTVLYMGDDIPDLKTMELVGLPACPADAAEEIKAISIYISPVIGGSGCARDVIEKVLKLQGKWMAGEAYSW